MADVWSEAFTFAGTRLRVDVAVAGKAYNRSVEHDGKPGQRCNARYVTFTRLAVVASDLFHSPSVFHRSVKVGHILRNAPSLIRW